MHWAVVLVIFVRVFVYFYTIKKPLKGLITSFVLDFLDGGVFYFTTSSVAYYELIDKPLDYLQYLILIFVARKTPILKYYLFFLSWRTLGMLFFYATGSRYAFIIFPNFVELSLLFYFVYDWAFKSDVKTRLTEWIIVINWKSPKLLLSLLALKLIQEIGLHGPTANSRTFWMWEQIAKYLSL